MKLRDFIPYLFILISPCLSAQPVITSFSPQSGAKGSTVTITGSGFDAVPGNNIVFFGAVRATVIAASANSISVTVPSAGTFHPISVTRAGLTGYSQQPFIITFNSAPTFDASSFATRQDFASGIYPRHASIGDLDGDGKSDIASANNNGGNISIFRNTSTPGTVTLAAPLFIASTNTSFGEQIKDMDADGNPDLVVNNYGGTIYVYRNTSTPGNINFLAPLILTTNQNPAWFEIADINSDGKPDIISMNQNSNTISVFKNNSTPGTLSFDTKIDFPIGERPYGGSIADIDGDSKPDLAIANGDVNTVSVFRNTSTTTTISFAAKINYTTGGFPFNVTLGDIDGDGKKEMLVPNSSGASFSVFVNSSTPGSISFSPKVDFATGTSPLYISLGDLNGDSKPDIAVANFATSSVSILKNNSTTGNLSLAAKMDYSTGMLDRSVPLGDIDGDGRPDIVSSNSTSDNISVLRNTTFPLPCPVSISLFPYRETFETSDGTWVSGGVASDWTWGAPSKTVISNAAQGNKCWITGGLASSSYSNGENSFLESPCFDFSTLIHPRISFNIFWETEKKYDGASMQYSIDGGGTWTTLGSVNSNSNCLGENWFNSPGIVYLGNAEGWSGNKQPTTGSCLGGSGSNSWLNASHDLTALAGEPRVKFRFLFGAGTTCNGFDGFAVDDVNIFEAPPNTANFSYSCKSNRTIDFTSLSICSTSSSWNFGDVASGANNTSLSANPSHVFSAPGTYSVVLTSTFATGAPSSITKQITVLDVTTAINQPIACHADKTGILSVTASGSALPYNYVWNTTPVQTSSIINNIGAGNYSVTVSSGLACPVTSTIIITEPPALTINTVVTAQLCSSANGSVISTVSGGTTPYIYSWSNGASTPDIINLTAGSYSLQIEDANGCRISKNNIVDHQQPGIIVNLGIDTSFCPGQSLLLNPGTYSSYLWQDNSVSPTFMATETGTYIVKVTDANGCTGTGTVSVTVDCSDLYFPKAFTPNNDGLNDQFGPAGNNFFAIKNYELKVYNRYGEMVFKSNNPYVKWNGKYKNAASDNASFVWMSTYNLNSKQVFKKGVVTLIH